jgi:hypothetical protein
VCTIFRELPVLIEWKNSVIKNVGSRCKKKPKQHYKNCADFVDSGKNVHKKSINRFSKTVTDISRNRGKRVHSTD